MTAPVVAHVNTPSSMADEVRKHDKTLGETGQGLMSEEKIREDTQLARSWGETFCTTWHTV